MATFSNNLRLTLIGTGEQAGTWGDTTNTNLGSLIEQAITGYATINIPDAQSTLSIGDGVSSDARSIALNISSTVTLTATQNVIVPTGSRLYAIRNSTLGGRSIVIKTLSDAGVTIANGTTAIVLCTGASVIDPFTAKVSKAGDSMTGALRVTNATDGYALFATTGADPFGANYDRFQIAVDTAQQKTYVGNYNGGSGSTRALEFVVGNVARFRINTAGSFDFYNNSGTKTASLDASGNFVVLGNITAYGTP